MERTMPMSTFSVTIYILAMTIPRFLISVSKNSIKSCILHNSDIHIIIALSLEKKKLSILRRQSIEKLIWKVLKPKQSQSFIV